MDGKLKTYTASGLVVLLALLFVIYEFRHAEVADHMTQEAREHIVPSMRYLEQMRFGVLRTVSSTSELIVANFASVEESGEQGETELIAEGRFEFLTAFSKLKQLLGAHHGHAEPQFSLEEIESAFTRLTAESEVILALIKNDAEAAELGEAKETFERREREVLSLLAEALSRSQSQSEELFDDMSEATLHLRDSIVWLGVSIVMILLVYTAYVVRLLKRESRARRHAETLAKAHEREVQRRKMIEANLASHQKLEALGTMLGGIAHSVNNYLTPIITLTKLLKSDFRQGSEEHEDLGRILSSAQNASQVLKDVLAFSRNEQPELSDKSEIVSCLRRALPVARAAIPASAKLSFETRLDESWVGLREADIETVILNLVGNAADALHEKPGDIRLLLDDVVVEQTEELSGEKHVLTPGRYSRLRISDTGCGIAADILPNIFDPFFTTKEVGKGSGLGLSVTYTTVTQVGGEIRVDSQVGEGTCFTLYLPLQSKVSIQEDAGYDERIKLSS